jgi:hypothetical protein
MPWNKFQGLFSDKSNRKNNLKIHEKILEYFLVEFFDIYKKNYANVISVN